jgi:hypothetical protein
VGLWAAAIGVVGFTPGVVRALGVEGNWPVGLWLSGSAPVCDGPALCTWARPIKPFQLISMH